MSQFSEEQQPMQPEQERAVINPFPNEQQAQLWPEQEGLDGEMFSFEEVEGQEYDARELIRQYARPEEALANEELWEKYQQEKGQ